MSVDKRWRLICYDIRDDKRYRKVFKLLRGTGYWVQYSIFRARLDDRETERLRWELARLMAAEDALLIVDLCPRCAEGIVSRNHVEGWSCEVVPFVVLGDGAAAHGPKSPRRTSRGPGAVRKVQAESEPKVLELPRKSDRKGDSGA